MISRRRALGLIAGATALPRAAAGAGASATRRFDILREGARIGTQSVTVRRDGDRLTAETRIEIAVKILGLTAYRYDLESRETWRAGQLVALSAQCDDDGARTRVEAQHDGTRLMIDGSGYQGPAPQEAAPTSYWSADFLRRGTWISTQSGALLEVSCTADGEVPLDTPAGPRRVARWQVRGGLELTLFYAQGEWAGSDFDAKGAEAQILARSLSPALPGLT